MSDETLTSEQEVRRGMEAQRVLDSEVYQDALRETEQELISRWKDARAVNVREELWAQVQALDAVEGTLRRYVNAGKHAEDRTERAAKLSPRE